MTDNWEKNPPEMEFRIRRHREEPWARHGERMCHTRPPGTSRGLYWTCVFISPTKMFNYYVPHKKTTLPSHTSYYLISYSLWAMFFYASTEMWKIKKNQHKLPNEDSKVPEWFVCYPQSFSTFHFIALINYTHSIQEHSEPKISIIFSMTANS